MDLLENAAGEARLMYSTVTKRNIPPMADLATITKRVADTRDLEMFLSMGPHIQNILSKTVATH